MPTRKEGAVQQADRSGVRLMRADGMEERIQDTFNAIARRAFEIFERKGSRGGHDWENWFQAESELFHPTHVELAEAEDALTLRAEVPGFSKKDLHVSLEPRRVTITGKRETREQKKKKRTIYTEQCSNEIFRVVDLPKEVDPAARGVKATYDQGVLTITIPEAGGAKSRRPKTGAKSSTV